MNIQRNGKTIELTAAEVEEAYREQLHNYRKQDAVKHLGDMFGGEPEEFSHKYGIDLDEMVKDDGFLDVCVERFEDELDCNIDENSQWENAIQTTLAEQQLNN